MTALKVAADHDVGPQESVEPEDLSQNPAFSYQVTAHRTKNLINVALGGTASQSSLSPWSKPGESANAISGRFWQDFAFHTAQDIMPWWEVDLQAVYPIEAIVVHNRVSMLQSRARTMTIEIAEHAGQWMPVHIGYASFGARGNGYPFELWLGSELKARYVRLSLREAQFFHLSQVEIFARGEQIALSSYCRQHGLTNFDVFSTDFGRPYTLEKANQAAPDIIVGLKINISGRFGNLLLQYTNAFEIARRTGLKYVQLGQSELMNVAGPIATDDLIILSPDAPLPPDGLFLCGVFFNSDVFLPLLGRFMQFTPADEVMHSSIAQAYIRPYLLSGLTLANKRHDDDEVTVHIRSGDIFAPDSYIESMYRQPPLSFYTLVIARMHEQGLMGRAQLVFEDKGNPCIEALEEWLLARGIPYKTQSGTLLDDMSALIDAPHLILGYGTFGYAVCRLSTQIQTVHYFAPELGGRYSFIPQIKQVYSVSDREGKYFRAGEWGNPGVGEWKNTAEQRAMMLTYPADALQVDDVTGQRDQSVWDR